MKKMGGKLLTYFVILAMIVVDYIILSYMNMLPESLQLTLPSYSRYRMMPVTGLDFTEMIRQHIENREVPKGTFDRIHSETPYSAHFTSYRAKGNTYVYSPVDSANSYTTKGGGSPTLYSNSGMKLEYGKVNLLFPRIGNPIAAAWGGEYYTLQYKANEELGYHRFKVSFLQELLVRQSSQPISIREYMILLEAWRRGQIIGWFPESGTAILDSWDSDTMERVIVKSTADGEVQEYRPDESLHIYGCFDENAVMCSWNEGTVLGYAYLPTGELVPKITDRNVQEAAICNSDGTRVVIISRNADTGGLELVDWKLTEGRYGVVTKMEQLNYSNVFAIVPMSDRIMIHADYTRNYEAMIKYYVIR